LHANEAIFFNNAQLIPSSLYTDFSARKEEAEKYVRQMILIPG